MSKPSGVPCRPVCDAALKIDKDAVPKECKGCKRMANKVYPCSNYYSEADAADACERPLCFACMIDSQTWCKACARSNPVTDLEAGED